MIEFEYFHRHLLVHQGCLHKCGHSLWPERKWHGRNGRGIKIKKKEEDELLSLIGHKDITVELLKSTYFRPYFLPVQFGA